MAARSRGECDWRTAIDWPAVLAGTIIDDDLSKRRLTAYLRPGVHRHLLRYIGEAGIESSVENCIQALVDEVRRDGVQFVEGVPKLLLQIVRAEIQARLKQRCAIRCR